MTEQQVAPTPLIDGGLRFEEVQRLLHVGLWVWDARDGTVQLSEESHRIHGIDPAEFDGRMTSYLDLTHPDDRLGHQEDLRGALAGDGTFEREHRVVRPGGAIRWVYERATVDIEGDRTVGLRGICLDVTDRKQATESLQHQVALLELGNRIATAANESSDLEEALRRCLEDFCELSGWSLGHAFLLHCGQIVDGEIWHLEDEVLLGSFRELAQAALPVRRSSLAERVMETSQPAWITDPGLTDADFEQGFDADRWWPEGERRLASGFGFPIVVDGELVAVVELFSGELRGADPLLMQTASHGANQLVRLVERTRARDALARQALHDPLTDLPNRSLFMDRLAQALRVLERQRAYLAVMFIDLDQFKSINDTLGHSVGDALLTTVASRLVRAMRPGDTAARFGGDEFMILCEGLPSESAAAKVAERLLRAITEPIGLDGEASTVVTASAGVVITNAVDAFPEDLVRDADVAMYRAKEGGGGRLHIFDPALHLRVSRKLAIADELRQAVHNQELYLVYQPQVRVSDGQVVGVEALVRWDNAVRGTLGPADFIPVAEDTQLIVPLGDWILQEACRQARLWRELAATPTNFKICVNISAAQLARPELVDAVARAVAEMRSDPADLCIEITERVLMHDASSSLRALLGLKTLGVSIAVDDFGTGYSSLEYLSRFPIDVIKIDKGFVDGLGQGSARAQSIVRGVVELSHALGVLPVAEGVETLGQVRDLAAVGCDIAQGYYFSRPRRPDAVWDALASMADHDS